LPRKHSYQDISDLFNDCGFELIDKIYKDTFTPLKCRCYKHPDIVQEITVHKLRYRRSECDYCIEYRKFIEAKKLFENKGYILLETEYKSTKTKMEYMCDKHPEETMYITIDNLKHGQGCRKCAYERMAEKQRTPFEDVKKVFELKGYKLLSKTYKNGSVKLDYICLKHPFKIQSTTYHSVKSGHGCPMCVGKFKATFDEVKSKFTERDYELLETEYINCGTPMMYRCNKHPEKIRTIKYNDFKRGIGCRGCIKRRKGSKSPNWKGGLSRLNEELRLKLKDWKYNQLEIFGFKCFISGENDGTIEIHHTISFNDLRDFALKTLNLPLSLKIGDYTDEEYEMIKSEIIWYHEFVTGVPMLKKYHVEFHKIYGVNADADDLIEYIDKVSLTGWKLDEFIDFS